MAQYPALVCMLDERNRATPACRRLDGAAALPEVELEQLGARVVCAAGIV